MAEDKRPFRLVVETDDTTRYVVTAAAKRRGPHSCQVLCFTRSSKLDEWCGSNRQELYASLDAFYSTLQIDIGGEVTIESDGTNESFVVSKEMLDSKDGYGVQRYTRRCKGAPCGTGMRSIGSSSPSTSSVLRSRVETTTSPTTSERGYGN